MGVVNCLFAHETGHLYYVDLENHDVMDTRAAGVCTDIKCMNADKDYLRNYLQLP